MAKKIDYKKQEKFVRSLGKQIQDDLTLFTNDMRQAFECLFDVIDEDYAKRPSGFGFTRKEKMDKINKAREIYSKHFA